MVEIESAVPFKQIERYGAPYGKPGVMLREVQNQSIVQIAAFPGAEKDLFKALGSELGIVVDGTAGRVGVNDDGSIRAVWISLNSYLVVASSMPDRVLHQRLAKACGSHALVTDQSAGRVCFELTGASVIDLLMMESATNFERDAFGPGESRAASWAGIACIVLFADGSDPDRPVYQLFPHRSFAQSLWEELCDAGREYAVEVIG